MHRACLVLLLTAPGAVAAQTVEPLDVVRRMAAAGAIEIALERVDKAQPREPSTPAWLEWETLRLELLARRGRDAEILTRVAAHRSLPERASVAMSSAAARSALRLRRNAEARQHLARVLLSPGLGEGDYRQARFAVIETYLAERNGDDAYRSMLRFQQDFAPLRREEAERFVSALLALDRVNDAAGWLPQLDPASPSVSILRLRAGLLAPEAAAAQGRALLAKGGGEGALALMLAAARAQRNRAIEIEVHELRLNVAAAGDAAALAERADQLWKLYAESAQEFANQAQLLSGDDAAWLARAAHMLPTQPQPGRALLAGLALNARSGEARGSAQLQLVNSLRGAKLGVVALRLFAAAGRVPVAALDNRVRYELGQLAAEQRQHAEAVRYWQNLPPPAGTSAQDWQLRQVSSLVQAGMVAAALDAAKSLLGSKPPPPEVVRRLLGIAAEALDAWNIEASQALYGLLLAVTAGSERIAVLAGLGRGHESSGAFRAAAASFLHAAALAPAPETDRDALKAREAGALNLSRAGMLADARATYQWLARHAKDPAVRDSAARALRHLPD